MPPEAQAANSNLLVAALATFLSTLYLASVITSKAYWHWLKAKHPSAVDEPKVLIGQRSRQILLAALSLACCHEAPADDDDADEGAELVRTFTVKKKAKACLCNRAVSSNVTCLLRGIKRTCHPIYRCFSVHF